MTALARRSFLTGLVALVASPAIVRADSLMAIRGVSLYPKLFMTVTLDGMSPTSWNENGCPHMPWAETLDVPWLGSVKDSMAWYNTKLTEIQSKFSRVNSIQWKEHMAEKSLFGRSAEATEAEVEWTKLKKPIPQQLLDGKPFAWPVIVNGTTPDFSQTMSPDNPPSEWVSRDQFVSVTNFGSVNRR